MNNKLSKDIVNLINKYLKPHPSNKYIFELQKSIEYIVFNTNLYDGSGSYIHPVIKKSNTLNNIWYTSYSSYRLDFRDDYLQRYNERFHGGIINS
jgi:hypothetical protein